MGLCSLEIFRDHQQDMTRLSLELNRNFLQINKTTEQRKEIVT